MSGIVDDPVSDGLAFTVQNMYGGTSFYPSRIAPYAEDGSAILNYNVTGNPCGAIKAELENYRLVYLAFGYEGIAETDQQTALMENALNWLLEITPAENVTAPIAQTGLQLSNYPNPFNPETTIEFSLPETANVELTIYNVKGQKVKNLINDEMAGGTHSIIWNGRNEAGEKTGSGVYFYRLKTADQTLSRKMILMK